MLRTNPVWLALLFLGPLHGQAAVEAALGAGRAATTTAPAQGLGKALGGLLGGLDKTLKPGQPSITAVTVPPEKMAAPNADSRTYEGPKLVQPGMAYDELLQRFGPPAMEITTAPGRKSLMFAGNDGATVRIELQDGKVLAAESPKTKPADSQQPAVIVLK